MIVVVDLAEKVHFFIPKLLNYLKQRKLPHVVIKNVDDLEKVRKIDVIFLTGSDLYVSNIAAYPRVYQLLKGVMQLSPKIPRIGICFGSQYLLAHAGGHLDRLPRAICSMRKIQTTLPVDDVQFCLHEVFAEPLPASLEPLAWARLGSKIRPCAFKYAHLPWYGFLFHPEANVASWKVLDQILSILTKK